MIRFDDFSYPDKLLRGEILLEINKIMMVSDQFSLEDYFQELLSGVRGYFGVEHAIIVDSSILSLECVLRALNCACSDEVLLSTYNTYDVVAAVKNIGALPVFLDIKRNLTIDTDLISLQISKKTKAIVYTNILGGLSDYKKVKSISRAHVIPCIQYISDINLRGSCINEIEGLDVACVNFMTSSSFGIGGQASVILSNNKEIHERLTTLLYSPLSSNYNYHKVISPVILDPITAAVFKVKFSHVASLEKKITKIINIYKENLAKNIYLGRNYILVENPSRLMEFMERKEVEIRGGYPCLHLSTQFSQGNRENAFMRSEDISSRVFRLPMHISLEEEDVKYVCESINYYLQCRPIHDSHQRRKNGKLTFVKDNKVVSLFKDRRVYLNTKKGYDYFSKTADVPNVVFKEESGKMAMISEFIHDEKYDMAFDVVLEKTGKLLSKLHQKGRVRTNDSLYKHLISKNYFPKHQEIVGLIEKYKRLFIEKSIYHIHGDFSVNNLLFNSDKIYLVDLNSYCLFDRYLDFASIYLNTCHEDSHQFSIFLRGYYAKADFNFSYERLYINVLIRLLDAFNAKYEHKRYPSRVLFDCYLNKLL